jgi:hypothetical protein
MPMVRFSFLGVDSAPHDDVDLMPTMIMWMPSMRHELARVPAGGAARQAGLRS